MEKFSRFVFHGQTAAKRYFTASGPWEGEILSGFSKSFGKPTGGRGKAVFSQRPKVTPARLEEPGTVSVR